MKKLLVTVAALAAVAGANASTVSYQYGLPVTQSTTEINQTGLLSKFDTALGTLTGFKLEIFGAATTTISLTNNAAQAQTARATSFVNLAWSSADSIIDAILADDVAINFTTGAAQSYAVGQTRSFGPLTGDGTFAYNITDAAALADVSGLGNFAITCASESGVTTIGGGGNVSSSQQTQAGCGAKITYTYDVVTPPPSVPEPASLALVGLALAGVAAARRRKA